MMLRSSAGLPTCASVNAMGNRQALISLIMSGHRGGLGGGGVRQQPEEGAQRGPLTCTVLCRMLQFPSKRISRVHSLRRSWAVLRNRSSCASVTGILCQVGRRYCCEQRVTSVDAMAEGLLRRSRALIRMMQQQLACWSSTGAQQQMHWFYLRDRMWAIPRSANDRVIPGLDPTNTCPQRPRYGRPGLARDTLSAGASQLPAGISADTVHVTAYAHRHPPRAHRCLA